MNQQQALEALPLTVAISLGHAVQWRSVDTRNLWTDWIGSPSDPRLGDTECGQVQWQIKTTSSASAIPEAEQLQTQLALERARLHDYHLLHDHLSDMVEGDRLRNGVSQVDYDILVALLVGIGRDR